MVKVEGSRDLEDKNLVECEKIPNFMEYKKNAKTQFDENQAFYLYQAKYQNL